MNEISNFQNCDRCHNPVKIINNRVFHLNNNNVCEGLHQVAEKYVDLCDYCKEPIEWDSVNNMWLHEQNDRMSHSHECHPEFPHIEPLKEGR